MTTFDPIDKVSRFEAALQLFLDRLKDDRTILAAVLVGSLDAEIIWRKETINLWLIETDGVTKRLRADGNDERIFRSLVEDGINLHVELIPRSRFKLMIDGSSRTAFHCNFFAQRRLVYCDDRSIENWFTEANEFATKDQEKELTAFMSWAVHAHRHASRRLKIKRDLELAMQDLLWTAHALAAIEIIRNGQVYEQESIYRALEHQPELFQVVYLDVLQSPRDESTLEAALERTDAYLEEHAEAFLKPILKYLRKQARTVPLTELCDHFAHSQLYPWHLESACEWLERKGLLEKIAAPFKLTRQSRVEVEEPAYFLDS